jgi:hypothetical protein
MNIKMQTIIKPNRAKRTAPLLLSISIMGILLASVGGLALSPAFGATSYNNVQIFAQTTDVTQGIFTIAAYNSSGFLVSSSQTMYPAAAFELPSGNYLFTVSAMDQTNYYPYAMPLTGSGTSTAGSPTATDVVPSTYEYPKVEYGFQLQEISGPSTLNIKTLPIENITLAKITVKVLFANGTAAADASVSASVVGAWYWWYGPDASLKMYTQTGADGVAQLAVPSVPVDVTAWDWLPVQLPTSQTTVPVNVGGETVNVTVYWQPTYVGLGGSALIIPPQNSATITLHVQQPTYWYMSKDLSGGASTGAMTPTVTSAPTDTSSSGTISNSASGVPTFISTQFSSSSASMSTLQTQIPSLTTTTASPGAVATSNNDYTFPLTIAVIVALAIAVLSFTLVLLRGRKKNLNSPAQ